MASHNAVSLPRDSSLRVMEPDLTCFICFELLNDPRDLNCPHVYCLHCLQKWVGNQPTVECPECRRVTIVPHGGLEHLRQNLRLKNMVEKYAAHGEASAAAVGRKRRVTKCELHEGERKHFLCVTCKVTVCRDCLVLNHPQGPEHDIQDLSKTVEIKKAESDMLLSDIKRQLEARREDRALLSKTFNQIEHDEATELDKIDQRIQTIICDTKAKGNALKLRVNRAYERERVKLRGNITNLEDRVQKLDELHAATQKQVSDSEDHVYLAEHASIVSKLKTELDRESRKPVKGSQTTTCKFHTGPSITENHLVGQLITKRELEFLAEFGQGSCTKAQDIASNTPGVLAVADSNKGRVSVYQMQDRNEYRRKFCLGPSGSSPNLAGKLINPCGVAVGVDGRYVVTDRSNAMLGMYTSTGRFDKCFESSDLKSSPQPTCVAATPNGMIVVGDNTREAISVHSPTGELVRTIQIRTKGINQIATNGQQIAYTKTDLEFGKVFVVDLESGQDIKELNVSYPTSICFDDRSGSLLIGRVGGAAVGNGSIDQYCLSTLTRINILADGLFMPLSMTVTSDDKLAVADCKSVKVYKMI